MLAFLTQTTGWWSGVLHPVQGPEHLVTMLLVGVMAGLCTVWGRSAWWAPTMFISGLAVGSSVGLAGWMRPDVRWLLFAVAGVLVVMMFLSSYVARALPLMSLGIGVLHGLSTGDELGASAHAAQFMAGVLFSACVAIACGAIIGLGVARTSLDRRPATPVVPAARVAAGHRAA